MLGRRLPKGPEAISFHNTLFRISELCWIKAVRLSIPEIVVRIAALILGVMWIFSMASAKGGYANVEFLLALFPLALAWHIAGSLKIGCSGDFEESYESRRGLQGSIFKNWIDVVASREKDWLHLSGGRYDLLINPHRIAWVRPCFQWRAFPLVVSAVFIGYLYLIGLGLDFETYPVLGDFMFLSFDTSTTGVKRLAYLIILIGVVSFLLSIKRSVEICGTGGVQDVFPLSADDQEMVLGIVAGAPLAKNAPKPKVEPKAVPKPKVEAKPKVQPAPVAEPTTKPKPPSVEKVNNPEDEVTIETQAVSPSAAPSSEPS